MVGKTIAALLTLAVMGTWNTPESFNDGLGPPSGPTVGPYDDDVWNEVYAAFYGPAEELDPFWGPTATSAFATNPELFTPTHAARAAKALDAWLARPRPPKPSRALARAFFQRDLWAAFDLLTSHGRDSAQWSRSLRARLATALGRLALTRGEIAGLPDNYAAAVASGSFSTTAPTPRDSTPHLPPKLLEKKGPWRCVGPRRGGLAARSHGRVLGGRSAFTIRLRVPGEDGATDAYLRQLAAVPTAIRIEGGRLRIRDDLPQLPVGSQVALVRQMLVIDTDGEIVPTPVVESVQLRILRRIGSRKVGCGGSLAPFQDASELRVSRPALLAGKHGGLVAVGPTDAPHSFFNAAHRLASRRPGSGPPHLKSCGSCHDQPGIYANPSFTGMPTGPGTIFHVETPGRLPGWIATDPATQIRIGIAWKKQQVSWGILQGLRDAARGR